METRGRVAAAALVALLLALVIGLLRPVSVPGIPVPDDFRTVVSAAAPTPVQGDANAGEAGTAPVGSARGEAPAVSPDGTAARGPSVRQAGRRGAELPTLPGRVIDSDTGLPVPRAHVKSVSMARTHTNTQHAWADLDGAFAVPVSPDATATWLEVSAEGYPTLHFFGPLGEGAPGPAPLRLVRGAPISGRVVAEDGTPVPGALVDARAVGDHPWSAARDLAKAGARDWVALGMGESQVAAGVNGAFVTGLLATGVPHVVTVRAGRGGPVIAEARDARPPTELTLASRGHAILRVRVVGPVVPGSWNVEARYMGDGGRRESTSIAGTGAEARLAIPPGEVEVALVTEGGVAALVQRGCRAAAGETLDVEWPVAQLAAALRPTLTLVPPPDMQAPDFVCLLQRAEDGHAGSACYRNVIGGEGGWRVHEAPAGTVHVVAFPGGDQLMVAAVDVPLALVGDAPVPATLCAVRTGTIRVRMRGEDALLVGMRRADGLPVVAWGQVWPSPEGFEIGMQDATEISVLLPGDYEVGSGETDVSAFPHRVTVREGETVEVTLP